MFSMLSQSAQPPPLLNSILPTFVLPIRSLHLFGFKTAVAIYTKLLKESPMAKQRLDDILVQRGLAESAELAQRLIRAAKVKVKGHPVTKPGTPYPADIEVEVELPPRFVSRGGDKLQGALDTWPIDLTGRVCIDIGSSTGGFTDCMLQSGASKVYAVDSGTNQLVWALRQDERVVVMEKCNARYLKPADLKTKDDTDDVPNFASVDVSFIGLDKIFPAMDEIMAEESEAVTLIKPQFEARREQVEKGGVVRDPLVHQEVQDRVVAETEANTRFRCQGIVISPLKGPSGNIEFLAYWKTTACLDNSPQA